MFYHVHSSAWKDVIFAARWITETTKEIWFVNWTTKARIPVVIPLSYLRRDSSLLSWLISRYDIKAFMCLKYIHVVLHWCCKVILFLFKFLFFVCLLQAHYRPSNSKVSFWKCLTICQKKNENKNKIQRSVISRISVLFCQVLPRIACKWKKMIHNFFASNWTKTFEFVKPEMINNL